MMKKILALALGLFVGASVQADFADLFRQGQEAGKKLVTAVKNRDVDALRGGVTELGTLVQEQLALAKKSKEYPTDTKTSVELKNKGSLIFVRLKIGDEYYTQDNTEIFEVKPGTTIALAPDISKDFEIAVYKERPHVLDRTAPHLSYRLPANKTAYLTWDDKVLRPQTGTGKGFFDRTDSGLSLKKNVKIADMKVV